MRFSVQDEHNAPGSPNHFKFSIRSLFTWFHLSGSVVLSVLRTSSGVDLALEVLLSVLHILCVVLQLEVL